MFCEALPRGGKRRGFPLKTADFVSLFIIPLLLSFAMSQPLSFSSPAELVARLTYEGARKAILDRRASLSSVSDVVAARAWVFELGDAVVRLSPLLLFHFSDASQTELQQSPLAAGIDKDSELSSLAHDVHNALIRFATNDWAARVPWAMGGHEELQRIVSTLPDGVTLDEAYSRLFVSAPGAAVPLTSSSVVAPVPVVSPVVASASASPAPILPLSVGVPPHSSRLSPLVVATSSALSRPGSRSPAGSSPALAASSPVGELLSSRPPSARSGVGATHPSPQGSALSMPLSSAPLPPVGGARPQRAGPSVFAAGASKVPRVCLSLFLRLFVYSLCPSSASAARRRRRGVS
jgi:hypothetical protein